MGAWPLPSFGSRRLGLWGWAPPPFFRAWPAGSAFWFWPHGANRRLGLGPTCALARWHGSYGEDALAVGVGRAKAPRLADARPLGREAICRRWRKKKLRTKSCRPNHSSFVNRSAPKGVALRWWGNGFAPVWFSALSAGPRPALIVGVVGAGFGTILPKTRPVGPVVLPGRFWWGRVFPQAPKSPQAEVPPVA